MILGIIMLNRNASFKTNKAFVPFLMKAQFCSCFKYYSSKSAIAASTEDFSVNSLEVSVFIALLVQIRGRDLKVQGISCCA